MLWPDLMQPQYKEDRILLSESVENVSLLVVLSLQNATCLAPQNAYQVLGLRRVSHTPEFLDLMPVTVQQWTRTPIFAWISGYSYSTNEQLRNTRGGAHTADTNRE